MTTAQELWGWGLCPGVSVGLLQVFGANFLHFLPGVQYLIAVGAGDVLQPFERIVGMRVGKPGIVAERCLPVKIPGLFSSQALGASLAPWWGAINFSSSDTRRVAVQLPAGYVTPHCLRHG